MSAITKEWLQQKIADMEATRDEIPFGLDEDDSNTLAALRIALASLEAHGKSYGPYVPAFIGPGVWAAIVDELPSEVVGRRVWVSTSPPAPVPMKDHQIRELVNELRDIAVEYHGTQQLRERIAITVRAAMLQGADGTLTNEGTIQDGNSPVITDELIRRIAFSLVYLAADEKMRSNEDSLFALVRRGIDIVRMELSANA
ncbi:Uncharacterised protein [Enterobacter cloacae]|uniref:hypothetical protein n=1 Tax=Enterobacter cloacae TaxID=550 RepID=UPI000793AF9F|nr:hypothetical protein [Enterobacter cloacae]CZU51293.1 Uncharacterised protein [Enterobacter cloacae]